MDDNTTKLDALNKDDPQLNEKTSDLIKARMQEELRKAELREELKIASARKEAQEKKAIKQNDAPNIQPLPQKEQVIQTSNSSEVTKDEYITGSRLKEVVQNINKSFSFIEKFIQEQQAENQKVNKFIAGLQNLINEYNKK